MNTLFLSLLGVSIFSLLIYFISNKFTRKNKDYIENNPIIKGEEDLKEYTSKEEPVLLKGTIKEAKNRRPKKETPKNKKSNSSDLNSSEDLPKSEKSSKKKYYSKKKKNSKKDKGDDLILS